MLSLDKVKRGFLHPDRDVRDAVAGYFDEHHIDDPEVMPLVIRCIGELSWHEAFSSYAFLSRLPQSGATLDWVVQRLQSIHRSQHGIKEHITTALTDTIVNADTQLLSQRLTQLLSQTALSAENRAAIISRIEIGSLPADAIFGQLESICRENGPDSVWPTEHMHQSNRLIQGLRRYPNECAHRVTQILTKQGEDYWPLELGVRLAGELRLTSTVPLLIDLLRDDGWLWEDCADALAWIGSDAGTDDLAQMFLSAEEAEPWRLAVVMSRVYTERSVAARLDLAGQTEDYETKCALVGSALQQFAAEAINPARDLISVLSPAEYDYGLLKALPVVCKLWNFPLPAMNDRDDDNSTDEVYRRIRVEKQAECIC